MHVIVITGSRAWKDPEPIKDVILGRLDHPKADLVLHGGYRGADLIAHDIAVEAGIMSVGIPACWKEFKGQAGPIRNTHLISAGAFQGVKGHDVRVYGFPLERSVGTWNCANIAKEKFLPVKIYNVDRQLFEDYK